MDTLVVCSQCESLNRVRLAEGEKKQPVCGKCAAPLPVHDGIQDVTAASLNALIKKSPRPVVIDFWAPWCGPCHAFAPIYRQAAQELGNKFVFAKINTQEHPVTNTTYQIRGIPTLAVFQGGLEVDRQSGLMPLPDLLEYLRRFAADR